MCLCWAVRRALRGGLDGAQLALTGLALCARRGRTAHRKGIHRYDPNNLHRKNEGYNERIEREKEAAIAKEKEGERALAQIKDSDLVILLDLHGSHWDSETFAKKLGEWQSTSSNLVFVIAGSLGPSPALTARANVRWKLSDLTFTHLMTRVLVLEQIYRGFMILGGRKYHK